MSGELRILTFCWHESYVRNLARAGHRWDVVPRSPWFVEQPWALARALPPNARVVSWPRAHMQLERGAYDLVVVHGPQDFEAASAGQAPTVAVVHDLPALHQALGTPKTAVDRLVDRASPAAIVYQSDEQQRAWGWPGEVIAPGLDAEEAPPYCGDQAGVLVASNLLCEAPEVTGFAWLERIGAGLPVLVYGANPSVARSVRPLREALAYARQHLRVFLNVVNPDLSHGCPPAMLDAMAAGMPVVTRPVSGGPIVDGRNGLVGADAGRLRLAVLETLEDAGRARDLGEAARQTIREHYPLEPFLGAWRRVLASAAAGHACQPAAATLASSA